MKVELNALFALKKPCANCPFLKEGAIDLAPGRLDGIIEHLTTDDMATFQCHKTVHSKRGGEWEEDEDGNSKYIPSGRESYCAGALIYLEKARKPTVAMRLGRAYGLYRPDEFKPHQGLVIEPKE